MNKHGKVKNYLIAAISTSARKLTENLNFIAFFDYLFK